jgi:hypothetical protein
LREQRPRQHEIFPLLRVARFIVRADAALLGPARSRGDVTLGEQQLCVLRWHRVEQGDHLRAQPGLPGLAHRL